MHRILCSADLTDVYYSYYVKSDEREREVEEEEEEEEDNSPPLTRVEKTLDYLGGIPHKQVGIHPRERQILLRQGVAFHPDFRDVV